MGYFTVEKSNPLYEQIYHSVKKMIMEGVFQPGERIYEAQLAREFGVSRSPVREAVRALQNDGLIYLDEKSQIFIYKPTLKDIREIYQCRMALESLAASLAAANASESELQQLAAVLDKTKDALTKGDVEQTIAQNTAFHDLVIAFSDNKRLQMQTNSLRALTNFYRVLNFQGENRGQTILKDHEAIYERIAAKDEQGASREMAQHMMRDMEHLIMLFKEKEMGEMEDENV